MMWRALALILFLFIFVLASTSHRVIVIGTSVSATSTSTEVGTPALAVATMGTFDQVGTLVFYPNNVEPVPYLFYQNEKGETVSKALTFDASPPATFSSWSGAHVEVIGIFYRERIVVSRITYIAAP